MRTILLAMTALALAAAPARATTLHCPSDLGKGRGEPILLIHGSGGSPGVWGWNWMRLGAARSLDVCTVAIPTSATGDIQLTVFAVVDAVREMSARSGERVDVLGHSQGGNQIRWAAKFWPDVRRRLDDVVMLGTPNHGTEVGKVLCAPGSCAAVNWQLSTGSRFIGAQNSGDPTPGRVDYTSIYTRTDELNVPAETARVEGATNLAVQDVCPGRWVHHFALLYDAAVTALALDALTRRGPADRSAFDPAACARFAMAGLSPAEAVREDARWYADGGMRVTRAQRTSAEPALQPYARGDAPAGA